MPDQRITLKDIAQRVGVSTGTVDRVVHKRGHVSAEIRDRIEHAMKEMGYAPNLAARSLANNNKPFRIAIILPDYRQDPYWAQPKEGLERAAESVRHYNVQTEFFSFSMFQPRDFLESVDKALESGPGAVLAAPLFLEEAKILLKGCQLQNIPLVFINTDIEGADILSYIGQDSYQSGVLAGRLLNFGLSDGDHAMLVNLDKEVSNARHLQDKERGFKDYFNGIDKKSIQIHTAVLENFDQPDFMREWAKKQFEQIPRLNGFFVTNSRAYKLVEALDAAVQDRVKIVGFDLIEPNLKLLAQGKIRFLINQNAWHQGYLGILTLVNKMLMSKEIPRTQYLPLDIIVKENVEYYLKRTLELPMVIV
ncbi:MAG: LacI family DNA-binding transcriptional regulator [Chitinophagales bacterium]|nr:LacI family DNA-binding transcriptional regulator [Chitinophagales bacterium]